MFVPMVLYGFSFIHLCTSLDVGRWFSTSVWKKVTDEKGWGGCSFLLKVIVADLNERKKGCGFYIEIRDVNVK